MKRLAALLVCAVACPAASAFAADWAGPYVGAGLGAFLGETRWTPRGPLTPFPDLPVSTVLDGTLLSGKLGYRLQANRWVFGVEADYARGRVDGSAPCLGNGTPVICTLELRSQLKLTGQIGYASGPWLPYLSFGYAQASGRASVFDPIDGPALAGEGTHRGGLVGVGLDYRISRWVSVGLEYQHIWYGSDAYALLPGSGPVTLGPSSTKIAIDPDYVGINVKIRADGN